MEGASSVSSQGYVFERHVAGPEHERDRLALLEAVHDQCTRDLLDRLGIGPRLRCAEIGAGAGSIARYMAHAVGAGGRVVAVDIDPRFLNMPDLPQIEIRRSDVMSDAFEAGAYDLIHARFVLMHLADPSAALDNLWTALKPGGGILLEEPDFRTAFSAAPDEDTRRAVDAVNEAVVAMYRRMGRDPGFGLQLPRLLASREGMVDLHVNVTSPLVPGGSPMALMMRSSVSHLRELLLETRVAEEVEIERYRDAACDPSVWASYYATISATARKAA